MKAFGLLATIAGLVLIVLSFIWVTLYPPESRWTEAQAKDHAQASARYHQLKHMVGGPHSHGPLQSGPKSSTQFTKADLDAAKERWEKSDAALQEARGQSRHSAWMLRIGGVLVAGVGVMVLAADRKRAKRNAAKCKPSDSWP